MGDVLVCGPLSSFETFLAPRTSGGTFQNAWHPSKLRRRALFVLTIASGIPPSFVVRAIVNAGAAGDSMIFPLPSTRVAQ